MFKRFEDLKASQSRFPNLRPISPLQGFLPFYAITPEGMKSH